MRPPGVRTEIVSPASPFQAEATAIECSVTTAPPSGVHCGAPERTRPVTTCVDRCVRPAKSRRCTVAARAAPASTRTTAAPRQPATRPGRKDSMERPPRRRTDREPGAPERPAAIGGRTLPETTGRDYPTPPARG